jgi:DNA-binding SARP family transcriptional activator/Tfp pilus assembly protein PilF
MLTLQLFGGCTLVADGEAITGPAVQRRRLALLAMLASSPGGAASRDKLIAYFWPDEERDQARHFLADSLFRLRKALGKDVLITVGDDVRINPDVLDSDTGRFEKLVANGAFAEAVVLYRGPFLDGFFVSDAPEFERWTEVERDRYARRYAWCLEQLAARCETEGDWAGATEWWRRLAAHDPYSSRVALRTMFALDASGDVAGALQHARVHDAHVRDELGLESDPTVMALADQLRARPVAPALPRPPVRRPDVRSPVPAPPRQPERERATARARRLTLRHLFAGGTVAALAVMAIVIVRAQRGAATPAGLGADRPVVTSATGTVSDARSTPRTRRDEARDLYTRGRYTLTKGQFDPAIHAQALQLFKQAAERDSTFAPAYAGMADVYNHANDPVRAKQAALKSITLDTALAEAYTSLAYVLAFYEYEWDAADSVLKRAIALSPRYVLAYLRRANVLAVQGRLDEARADVESAGEIQPESFVVMLNRGLMANVAGRPDEAIARFQDALALEPGRKDAQVMLVRAYWGDERYSDAQQVMRSIGDIAGVSAMSGNRDTMARLAPVFASSSTLDSIQMAAALYARLGRTAEAFVQLDRLYRRRDKHLPLSLRQQPLVTLRGDPRYDQLLGKLRMK